MADVTRDVVARLKVEKDGDAGAFREAAGDIGSLADSAGSATGPVAELLDKLAEAGASREQIQALSPALDDVAKAAERFANAKGLDEQKRAIADLRAGWEGLGKSVEKSFADGGKAAETFRSGLEQIRRMEDSLAEPLTASLKKAEAAVKDFEKAAESGGTGAARAATTAKLAVEQYAGALAAAKRAGENLTDEQIAGLNRLGEAYQGAIRKTAEYKNAQDDVGKSIRSARAETDLGRGSINDLGDIVERANPKLGDLVAKGFALAGAFRAGWDAGGKLREVLNDLSDGGFDKGLQTFITRLGDLDEGLNTAAQEGDRVRAMMNVLEKNGIDPLGKSLAELEEAYAGLIAKKREAAAAAEAQTAAETKTAEGGKRTREAISDQEKAIGSLVSQIMGPGKAAQASLAEQNAVLQGTFARLGEVTGLNSQQMARLKEQVGALVERFRASKEDIPAWLVEAADKTGVFVAAMERSGGVIETFIGKGKALKGAELAEEMKKLERATEGAGSSFQETASSADSAGKGLDAAGKGAQALSEAATSGKPALSALSSELTATKSAADGLPASIRAIADAVNALGSLKLGGLRAELQGAKADADALAASLRAVDADSPAGAG